MEEEGLRHKPIYHAHSHQLKSLRVYQCKKKKKKKKTLEVEVTYVIARAVKKQSQSVVGTQRPLATRPLLLWLFHLFLNINEWHAGYWKK